MRLRLAALLIAAFPIAASAQDPAPAPQAAPQTAPQNAPQPAPDTWVQKGTADLILLDKIRALPSPVSLKVGDTTGFGSLTVKLLSCFARPPDQPADSAAFVVVSDSRTNSDVFRGWILANTPSVSQMEHPVYDLKLAQCH